MEKYTREREDLRYVNPTKESADLVNEQCDR